MEDRQLIESLLKRQESDDLDFKSDQYNFDDSNGKSKFIKDIVAMANTPRSGPAYILVGVQEQSGKVRGTTGMTDHPDGALLGGVVSGKVYPAPRFTYRQIVHDGVKLGLIEIPCDQPVPVMPRTDYGVLRRGCVYIRRNTRNTEADKTDLARINEWGQSQSEPPSDPRNTLNKGCRGFLAVTGGVSRKYSGLQGCFPRCSALSSRSGGAVAGLERPGRRPPTRFGPLRPCQPVSWPSAVSRLPKPKSSARRSVFFASPR